MVNKTVLEYLRVNKGNYNVADLKKKILSSGYSAKDLDDAMAQLNKETQGSAPSVASTVKQINKTNLSETAPGKVVPATPITPIDSKNLTQTSKKSKTWLWVTLIVILVLLLAGGGFAAWWFFLKA